jgi:hypothetical protein
MAAMEILGESVPTAMVKAFCTVAFPASVTRTVNVLAVCAVVGVPVIRPFAAKAKPGGRTPAVAPVTKLHV